MFLTIVIIIIILLYIYGYFNFPKNTSILQTNDNDLRSNILLERQPVIVEDTIKPDIKSRLFKFGFVKNMSLLPNTWYINNNKQMCITSLNKTEVLICSPNTKMVSGAPIESANIIAIPLEVNQTIILPFKWRLLLNNNGVNILVNNDIITSIFGKL